MLLPIYMKHSIYFLAQCKLSADAGSRDVQLKEEMRDTKGIRHFQARPTCGRIFCIAAQLHQSIKAFTAGLVGLGVPQLGRQLQLDSLRGCILYLDQPTAMCK